MMDAFARNIRFSHREDSTVLLLMLGICAVLAGLLISQFSSPLYTFGFIGLLASCVGVATNWPRGALLVMLIACVTPRMTLGVGAWNARPEHYAVGLFVLAFIIQWILCYRVRLALTGADYCLIAYIIWNYVSSALMSPDPKQTLRWALLNNLVILPFWLIRATARDARAVRWIFRAFLSVGIAECLYGIVSFASHQLFGTSFGVEVGQYATGVGGVFGTQYEPNLFGSYAASLAVVLLVVYFLEERKSAWVLLGAIVAVCAMLVSLSRAALLSFAFVVIILMILGLRSGVIRAKKAALLTACLVLFSMPVLQTTGQNLAERFASLTGGTGALGDTDTVARLVAWTLAIEDISQHPVVGNGTASFQLLADAKQIPILGERPWVGNSVLRIMHDAGVIGLVLFGLLFVAIGRQVRDRIANRVEGREIIIALSAGCLIYAIAFMSTEGTVLAFFWVHAGLLASAVTLTNPSRHSAFSRAET